MCDNSTDKTARRFTAELGLTYDQGGAHRRRTALPAPRSGSRPRAHGRAELHAAIRLIGWLMPASRLSGAARNPSRALRVACGDGLAAIPD